MSEFAVFAEKKAFEEIVFNEGYPNLKSIFTGHAKLYLNIPKDQLDQALQTDSEILLFLQAYAAAKVPESYEAQFENVYDDPVHLISTPRSMYFLNISKADADKMQSQFGIVVQSVDAIDDTVLKSTYSKTLKENTLCSSPGKIGWKHLLNIPLPPLNAIVLSDNYLFANEEGIRGTSNFLQLLEAVLPNHLAVDFHILLISREHKDKDRLWCERKVGEIKAALYNLKKPYNIIFEMVFSETIHKRIAISNYFVIVADQGYAMFKSNDLSTVHEDTDVTVERLFHRTEPHEGDTVFINSSYWLEKIKGNCISLAQYIANRPDDKNYRIMGDCNKDKSINNRLVNVV